MSNLPNWALGLVIILAILLIGFVHGSGPALMKPVVLDVAELGPPSVQAERGLHLNLIGYARSGEVWQERLVDFSIPLHYHEGNEVAYVLDGQLTLKYADGSTGAISAGQLAIFPAGVASAISGSGAFLVFNTPPESKGSTFWLEGPDSKAGAKAPSMDKPTIIDAAQRIAQGLDQQREGFQFTFVYEVPTGSVELFRIDKGVALHKHPKENHVLYILKGRGQGTIGNQTAEVGPGQIVVIPANVPHKLERIGDLPLDFILFSTPAFNPNDIVWLK